MKTIQDTYTRTGGKRHGIVRKKPAQEISSVYSTDPAERRRFNSRINNVHVNRNRCS